jgi:hypothetical protein
VFRIATELFVTALVKPRVEEKLGRVKPGTLP